MRAFTVCDVLISRQKTVGVARVSSAVAKKIK